MMINPNPTEATMSYFTMKMAKINAIAHTKTLDSFGISRTEVHTVLEGGQEEEEKIKNLTEGSQAQSLQWNNINREQKHDEYGFTLQLQNKRTRQAEDLFGPISKDSVNKNNQNRNLESLFGKVSPNALQQ